MEDYGGKEQAEEDAFSNKPKKRGRKSTLTQEEKRKKKKENNKKYQEKIASEKIELKKENEELKKKKEAQQLEINMLKEQHSETTARTDKLAREMSDFVNATKTANKVLESRMQQLEEKIINQNDQEHDAGNSQFNIPMDLDYLKSLHLEDFIPEGVVDIDVLVDSCLSKTKAIFPSPYDQP